MSDSIFDSDCHAIVNTTNCDGEMGAGLAGQFRSLYPSMYKHYRIACVNGEHKLGEVMLYRTQFDITHQVVS